MNKRNLAVLSLLVAGCAGSLPLAQRSATLILKPRVTEGQFTQGTVGVYTSASIDHLTIKLFQGGNEAASKTILQAQLANPIAFSNLKTNTAYRITSYAYLADNTLISHEASSTLNILTQTDDHPGIATLPVFLIDRLFNSQGTGSLQVTNGGYLAGDPENLQFTLSGIMTTLAGNGTASYSGDGGAGTSATLNNPCAVAVDSAGNVYVADFSNNRIRKIAPNGTITTIAGNGTNASSGDGGAATLASISAPNALAVDGAGNVYFSEPLQYRVRKVSSTGTITLFAGSGGTSFSGDGGAATLASLNRPYGLAADEAGNVYIADTYNHRIRKVAANGTINTVAGNGTATCSGDGGAATLASLSSPFGVAVDKAGNLYVADQVNRRIRKVSTDGTITTLAGNGTRAYAGDGGLATLSMLDGPRAVAVDEAGNVYFVDEYVHRIRKITKDGWILTAAGNGTAGYSGDGSQAQLGTLNKPIGVAVDKAGHIFIGDTLNHSVRRVQ